MRTILPRGSQEVVVDNDQTLHRNARVNMIYWPEVDSPMVSNIGKSLGMPASWRLKSPG